MFGSVSIVGGDGDTTFRMDDSRLEGTSVYPYPIIIQHPDPQVLIEGNSVVIGGSSESGYEAVRWEVDNPNVLIKYSTITHGSFGVGNNPFMTTVVGPAIQYASHHNAYNANPQTGGSFANSVSANMYDTYDPAAVY
jgi:hypothetical protein